ncbi:hypothetical protein KWI07_17320 [Enterobacter bugandensis]|uniref:hypothetical protein n=1 Tax=Enterobacter bugandensis TaxID=881260 RepID=UPI0021D36A2C|nr:hypothetical protein [Enterobacter bugandensis]MCU6162194.1 hypothetical protein [Enterobacter bugandensis]
MEVSDAPSFSGALEANGLERELKIEEFLSYITYLKAELRNREYQLEKITLEHVSFLVFEYQLSPSVPVKSAGSPPFLIAALLFLLGRREMCVSSVLGCG